MGKALFSADINIRPLQREDIPALVEYWTGSSKEFWQERGVDISKMLSPEAFTAIYEKSFAEKGEVRGVVTILLRGKPVGVHTLTEVIEGQSAVFHAHIFRKENRRIGIGFFSYLKAVDFFLSALKLKKIVFKTAKLNAAANRVKEKIGIPLLGDTVFNAPILFAPLPANLYELDRALLDALKAKHGI